MYNDDERIMGYFIYENWTHDYVSIHKADCNMCNYGKGMHAKTSIKNGVWIGPLKDRQEVEFVASKLRRKTISKCSKCL